MYLLGFYNLQKIGTGIYTVSIKEDQSISDGRIVENIKVSKTDFSFHILRIFNQNKFIVNRNEKVINTNWMIANENKQFKRMIKG